MEFRTHFIGGVAAGMAVVVYTDAHPLWTVGAAMVGSLLPDIDHGKSKISNSNVITQLLSFAVNLFFTHRTFTHSLVFLLLLLWPLSYAPIIAPGFLAGVASHLLLDAMTKNGIKLFWPLPLNFRIPFYIRTGGVAERFVEMLLIGCIIYLTGELYKVF